MPRSLENSKAVGIRLRSPRNGTQSPQFGTSTLQDQSPQWPTREHGEKSQKQLSSLPVAAGWIFVSEVSLKSKFYLCGTWTQHISYEFKQKLNLSLRSFENKCLVSGYFPKKTLDLDGSTPEPAIQSSDTGQRIPCFDCCQLLQHWCPICVSIFLCSDPKLARKYETEHWSRSSKIINWSADSFQINHVTSMSWHMSPRYGHWSLVSGYPVLTAINWPYCECPM